MTPWDSSVRAMPATRSASGPMEAPRVPAPMSVGAPISATVVAMARGRPSGRPDQSRPRDACTERAAEQILRVVEHGHEVDFAPWDVTLAEQRMQEAQCRVILERESDRIEDRHVGVAAASLGAAQYDVGEFGDRVGSVHLLDLALDARLRLVLDDYARFRHAQDVRVQL